MKFMCRKIDNKVIQVEGEIYWEVDTIAFRFYYALQPEEITWKGIWVSCVYYQ